MDSRRPFSSHKTQNHALQNLTVIDVTGTVAPAASGKAAGFLARDRGLSIPGDLSFVGFDNSPMSRYIRPGLSTIDYPIGDMSRMAVRWVLKEIYQEDGPEIQNVFEPSLLVRDSVSPYGA